MGREAAAASQMQQHGDICAEEDQGAQQPRRQSFSLSSPQPQHEASIVFESASALQGRARAGLVEQIGAETSRLLMLAGPLLAQNACAYSSVLVSIAFVGHMASDDPSLLSAVVLANSLFNVTGYSIISGLAAGMETLCGQAYGARSFSTLGLVLQRALLVLWLVCLPIHALWAHAEPLLLGLGQAPRIAAGAAQYLWLISPTLYLAALVECLKRYLLAQRVVLPGMAVTIVTSMLCPVFNWLLIFRLGLGLRGAAYAFVLSQAASAALLVAYVAWRDACLLAGSDEATWAAPSRSALQGWGSFLAFAVPACLQICVEWWTYEVVILAAGTLPGAEVAVGVMGLCFQVSALAYMSGMAASAAVNTRVGNELGSGRGSAARLATWTCVGCVALVQSSLAVACWFARWQVVGLLSNNAEVLALTVATLPILLPTFVGDALNAVAQGVLRGAGRPGVGAALSLAGYWLCGIPLAWLLGLRLGWGVAGFWTGLLATTVSMSLVQLGYIHCFDWQRECQRAAELTAKQAAEAADGKAAALAAAGLAPAAVCGKQRRQRQQQQQQQQQQQWRGRLLAWWRAKQGWAPVGSAAAAAAASADDSSGGCCEAQGLPQPRPAGLVRPQDSLHRQLLQSQDSLSLGGPLRS